MTGLLGHAAPAIDHRDLLASAEEVDALPVTVTRLAELVAAEEQDLQRIAEVVELDQALTATLLRRANAAAVAPIRAITTVREAVVRLGPGALLAMALATSVGTRMNRALPVYGLSEGMLWKHSVAASVAADVIRSRAGVEVPAEASTAALLHDFGKVVLSRHFGPKVLGLLRGAALSEGVDVLEVERSIFGLTHADIGGVVAQQWRLPHTITDAILRHHDTSSAHTPVSAVVSLAHGMVEDVLRVGDDPEDVHRDPVTQTHGAVLALLAVPEGGYADMLMVARSRYVDLTHRYGT